MHTISMLRRALGLSSDNQVRNRMERIKDLLAEHIRRGPNNQIFLTEPGLELMKQFQELYDTGLTLAEASTVVRTTSYRYDPSPVPVSSRSVSNELKPSRPTSDMTSDLLEEMVLIRSQLTALQAQLPSSINNPAAPAGAQPWWTYLREDIDVT
ncbi:hypothetical protein KAH43_05075 [Candidatus Bipolaricaulota bacterium]|nr:hypothetical protein [Candidatus Bipolaricaulota bacterium]